MVDREFSWHTAHSGLIPGTLNGSPSTVLSGKPGISPDNCSVWPNKQTKLKQGKVSNQECRPPLKNLEKQEQIHPKKWEEGKNNRNE